MRTVIPQATYAQAPIIAKITAAPLFAKFSQAPAKTTFGAQNYASLVAGSARASLHSFGAVQTGGPVVSQVYAAPSATSYATSPSLRVQQPQVFPPTSYSAPVALTNTQYNQVGSVQNLPQVSQIAQYSSSSVSQASSASASSYFTPSVSQYSAPVLASQYAGAATYAGPAAAITQVAAPVIQYSAPFSKYVAPAVNQYSQYNSAGLAQLSSIRASAPAVAHIRAPVATHVAVSAPVTHINSVAVAPTKNVHTEFLENYVSTYA
jgi:hypothetical protein